MHIYDELAACIRASGSPRPLILLDVDDTLIDCRHRKHKVFMDFIERQASKQRWPKACSRLALLKWNQIHYRVQDNLKFIGIEDRSFGEALFQFWLQHYFSYPYLINDVAFPGAVDFVKHCHRELGLQIVYLTARDVKGMGQATYDTIATLGFPSQGPDIHYVLKQDPSQSDFDFKVSALETIAQLGHVVAALENELSNLNAMASRFPDAAMYWRNTLYAPNPPQPAPGVKILHAF